MKRIIYVLLTMVLLGSFDTFLSQAAERATVKNELTGSAWEKILAAAKQEGKLVLTAEPSELWRQAIVEPFQKKYPEIKVEFTGLTGKDFRPRIEQERKVGYYLWDLKQGGISPSVYELKNKGGLNDPLRPLLFSEITQESKWIGGLDALFADKEKKYFAAPLAYIQPTILVNRDFIPESEIVSPKELLNPKYYGKIVLQEPSAGAGLSAVTLLLDKYGETFVRDLLVKQKVMITKDERQQAEWVIRGRYPIGLGIEPDNMAPFLKQGLGLNVKAVSNASYMSIRHIQLINKAPHPNAARVYVNWYLSQEGQTAITKIAGVSSRRSDVKPPVGQAVVDPAIVSPLVEEKLPIRRLAEKIAKEFIK